ncbi:RNase H domain-containing protein [Trichonephila clavipes]|nr:RNase H domain-containing protein [Trichonephila clavipes]
MRNDIEKCSHSRIQKLRIHCQWIPSHVNITENEIADSLARTGAGETTTPHTPLSYLELFSKYKANNKAIWMIPPLHPWYQSKYTGGTLVRGSSREDQTALNRFLSGHLMAYQAGLGSRSPIGFELLQGEWTHGLDLVLLFSGMRNNNNIEVLRELRERVYPLGAWGGRPGKLDLIGSKRNALDPSVPREPVALLHS